MKSSTFITLLFLIGTSTLPLADALAQCQSPSNLSTTNILGTSADLAWSAVSGARRYRLQYRVSGTTNWTSIRTRNTQITISNLIPGNTYDWKVKTICRGQSSSYSPISSFTTASTCPIPTPFMPLGIGSHQATLVWLNINSQVSSYNLRWREVGHSTWNVVTGISTNLYIVEDLSPLTTYEYAVQSVCGGTNSVFSSTVQWTTPENVCTAPLGYQVTNLSTDFVSLLWQAVGGTEHYRIRYRTIGSATWLFKDFIGSTSTTISNLFPNTTYESQVQSECTLGATDWSQLISFTTDQISACTSPQNLFASMVSATSATHNWDPVVGALDYTMRRRIEGTQGWTSFQTTQTSLTTYLLASGTTYEFQVKAHCNIGDSPFSPSAFYTTQGDPPCPQATNLIVDDITPTSADFDWDDVPGVLHYRFEWRPQGSTNWSWVQTTSSHIARSGLLPDTPYEWRVGSLCTSGGTYTFSSIESFVTASAGQCTVPSGLFVLGLGQTQATLIWSSVPEANSYDVRLRPTGSSSWSTLSGITSNLKVVSGLIPGTEYEWQVSAQCSSGSSNFSSSDLFVTQAASDAQSNSSWQQNLSQNQHREALAKIYPNPTSNLLVIEGENLQTILVYNGVGQLVIAKKLGPEVEKSIIKLREYELGAGLFMVITKTEQGWTAPQKIILEK